MKINIFGVIGSVAGSEKEKSFTLSDLKAVLDNKTDNEPIELFIDSPGGLTDEGKAIYDYLKNRSEKIIGHVVGDCDSMASVILCACDETDITPQGSILWHNPSWNFDKGEIKDVLTLNANDLDALKTSLEETANMMAGIYTEYTGKSENEVVSFMCGEYGYGTIFDAKTAIKEGLVGGMCKQFALKQVMFIPRKQRVITYKFQADVQKVAFISQRKEVKKMKRPKSQINGSGIKAFTDKFGKKRAFKAAENQEEEVAEANEEEPAEHDENNDGAEAEMEGNDINDPLEQASDEDIEAVDGAAHVECFVCGADIAYDPETASRGTDPNGVDSYELICGACGAGLYVPTEGNFEANLDPKDVVMYKKGVADGVKIGMSKGRKRQAGLLGLAKDFPEYQSIIEKGWQAGMSVTQVEKNIITAIRQNPNRGGKPLSKSEAFISRMAAGSMAAFSDAEGNNMLGHIGKGSVRGRNTNAFQAGREAAYGKKPAEANK